MSSRLEDERTALVEERQAKLEALAEQRDALLAQMFQLVRLGEKGGAALIYRNEEEEEEEENDEDEGGEEISEGREEKGALREFMERFNLYKDPQNGSIVTLELPELHYDVEESPTPSEESPAESVAAELEENDPEPQADAVPTEGAREEEEDEEEEEEEEEENRMPEPSAQEQMEIEETEAEQQVAAEEAVEALRVDETEQNRQEDADDEAEAEVEMEAEAVVETEADADTDVEADADAEVEVDADAEVEVDADAEVEVDADAGVEVDADAEVEEAPPEEELPSDEEDENEDEDEEPPTERDETPQTPLTSRSERARRRAQHSEDAEDEIEADEEEEEAEEAARNEAMHAEARAEEEMDVDEEATEPSPKPADPTEEPKFSEDGDEGSENDQEQEDQEREEQEDAALAAEGVEEDDDEDEEEEEDEPEPEAEELQKPERRRTRSISRREATSPTEELDDEPDELDIISLASASDAGRSFEVPSAGPSTSRQASQEAIIMPEDEETEKREEVQNDEVEEELADEIHDQTIEELRAENADEAKLPDQEVVDSPARAPDNPMTSEDLQYIPPSPSRSPTKSPTPAGVKTPITTRKKLIMPFPPDTTPLSPPKPPPPPIIVRLSSSPQKGTTDKEYHFSDIDFHLPEVPIDKPTATAQRLRKAMDYTLPAVADLPVEFNRKGKPGKSKKRDRDRERSASESGGKKDDWTAMGMVRWHALLSTNPVYKRMSRASKYISSQDWNTAMTELKLLRALERIENLKRAGRWSFRQIKKQRTGAGLVKTHWDYLMDEMKWLQTDFRQERRWKLALAFKISLWVLEWHAAGSMEERIRLGICAMWRKPKLKPVSVEDYTLPDDNAMDLDGPLMPIVDGMEEQNESDDDGREERPRTDLAELGLSEDEHENESKDQETVDDVLRPDNMLVDALEDAQQQSAAAPVDAESRIMKLEEVDGTEALRSVSVQINTTDDVTGDSQDIVTLDAKTEIIDQSNALKDTSQNPLMDAGAPAETQPMGQRDIWTADEAKTIRSSLLSLPMDTLFANLEDFVPMSDEGRSTGDAIAYPDMGLSSIFPELQAFSMVDVASSDPYGPASEVKKKGDKKADRDDPTKRVEETTYNKIDPISQFMYNKPVLVGALEPARRWRKGMWVDLDESPVVSDVDGPPQNVANSESSCALFEGGRRSSAQHREHGPIIVVNQSKTVRGAEKSSEDGRSRADKLPSAEWSPAEDNLLKSLVERYSHNWRLIADALNSSSIRSRIDLRTPLQCYERWRAAFTMFNRVTQPGSSAGSYFMAEDSTSVPPSAASDMPPPTPSASTSQMTTRGIKRAATNAAQNASNLTVNTVANSVETRKRRRHVILNESMRKSTRRRDAFRNAAKDKKQLAAVHDTHQLGGTQKRYSPAELSLMKAERERKEQEALAIRREQENEIRRQRLLQVHQAQQAQLAAQVQQQQQHQQHQQQQAQPPQPGQTNQQSNAVLPQNIPQIRSQMMQQAQQVRALAQVQAQAQAQAQAQGQLQGQQPQQMQMQMQMQAGQLPIGQVGTLQVNGVPQVGTSAYGALGRMAGAASPVPPQASPPRASATPVNAAAIAGFPRPASAQRAAAIQMPGGQMLPMAGTQVPIARTNSALAAYFGGSYTQEQMSQVLRYHMQQQQQAQQAQQAANQHQPQQLQQALQMQQAQQGQMPQTGASGYHPPTNQ